MTYPAIHYVRLYADQDRPEHVYMNGNGYGMIVMAPNYKDNSSLYVLGYPYGDSWDEGFIDYVYSEQVYTIAQDRASLAARSVALEPVDSERLATRFLHLGVHQAVGSGAAVLVAEDLLAAFPEAVPTLKRPPACAQAGDSSADGLAESELLAVNKAVVYDAAVAILPWQLRRLEEVEARLRSLDDVDKKLRRLEEIERVLPSVLRRLEELEKRCPSV